MLGANPNTKYAIEFQKLDTMSNMGEIIEHWHANY